MVSWKNIPLQFLWKHWTEPTTVITQTFHHFRPKTQQHRLYCVWWLNVLLLGSWERKRDCFLTSIVWEQLRCWVEQIWHRCARMSRLFPFINLSLSWNKIHTLWCVTQECQGLSHHVGSPFYTDIVLPLRLDLLPIYCHNNPLYFVRVSFIQNSKVE